MPSGQRARLARRTTRRSWPPCNRMKATSLVKVKPTGCFGLLIHLATERATERFWKETSDAKGLYALFAADGLLCAQEHWMMALAIFLADFANHHPEESIFKSSFIA